MAEENKPQVEKSESETMETADATMAKKSSKAPLFIGLAVIAVLVILGLVALAFILINNQNSNTVSSGSGSESSASATASGGGAADTNVEQDQALIAKVQEALAGIDTAEYTLGMDLDMTIAFDESLGLGSEPQSISTYTTATGKVDNTNKALQIDMDVSVAGQSVSVSQILVDGKVYVNQDNEGYKLYSAAELESLGVTGTAFTYDDWASQQAWAQVAEGKSTITYLGEEDVEGIPTYKFSINVDESVYNQLIGQSEEELVETYSSLGLGITADDIDFNIGNASSTIWIVQEDLQPLTQNMVLDGASIEIKNLLTMTIDTLDVRMDFSSVNEPVSIKAPI